jgi:hypothetical protein
MLTFVHACRRAWPPKFLHAYVLEFRGRYEAHVKVSFNFKYIRDLETVFKMSLVYVSAGKAGSCGLLMKKNLGEILCRFPFKEMDVKKVSNTDLSSHVGIS